MATLTRVRPSTSSTSPGRRQAISRSGSVGATVLSPRTVYCR